MLTYSKGTVRRHVVGLLYPAGGGRGRLIRIPADSPFTDEPGSSVWVEDLRTRRWFSRGSRTARVSSLPMDRSFSLPNNYSVITTRCSSTASVNRTISLQLGQTVRGHVIVVRHAARSFMPLTNVLQTERRFIDFIVRRYVTLGSFKSASLSYIM